MKTIITVVLAAVLAAACYPIRRADPIVGPFVAADPAVERGRVLFDRHCYKCHTEGEGGMGPVINDKPLPRFLMRLQTRAGLGAMPSIPKEQLSDDELDDILNYIVALRHHGRGAGRGS